MRAMADYTDTAVTTPELTRQVTRGVCRYLSDLGYSVLTEFTLRNGRRAAEIAPLHASRRRVLTLKLARKAAQRLYNLTDPRI
jgi:hypothetical protein